MGFSLRSAKPGGRRRHSASCEINVTPLVDVMLVLLIVFMITSPMLVAGVNVDLPESKVSPIASQEEPLVISVDKKGDIFIFETKIEQEQLKEKLLSITQEKKDTKIFIRGDKSVSYGIIASVMSKIQQAGFTKIALIANIKYDQK